MSIPRRSRVSSVTFLAAMLVLGNHLVVTAEQPPANQTVIPDDAMRISLPAQLYAVAGVECNVYFDNVTLLLNPANYAFDVTCAKGRQQSERWTWTPTEADVGDHPFQLDVRDERNRRVSQCNTTIRVFAANPAKKRKRSLLLIGDSLTHTSVYSQHLLDLSTKFGDPALTLIGSHWIGATPGPNRHEGYGGWTAQRFASHFTDVARQGDYSKRGSPFLYKQPDGSLKLDFQHYCTDVNEGNLPDVVTIFLGPNDIFSLNDETIADGVETMLSHYEKLIEMVRTSSPSTRLGVMLPAPPAASQDAFGSNYAAGQTRWQYKRNQYTLVNAMIKKYANRQAEKIDLISTHANLDCVHNYPVETVLPNAQADEKVIRQNNGVHPSPAGYRQIGDTLFAWLASFD